MTPHITPEYPNPGDAILAKRGILKQARAAGWEAYRLKDGRLGWRIPTWTHDNKPGRPFWKAQDSVKPKYQWLSKGQQPKLYTGAVRPDDVKRAVNREGVLVVTGGQPALLAYQTTGRDNAVCCFGESLLPPADHMRQWVSAGDLILHIPDRDETGDRQTVALAALAAEIGCAYARIELDDLWAGYDLNDALMLCLETGDDFNTSLKAYTLIHAPAIMPEPLHITQQGRAEPRPRTESGDSYHATRTHLLKQLRANTPRGLDVIRCPHPKHEDKEPSAQIGHSQVTCHSRHCHHDWRGMWDGIAQRCGYASFIDAVHQIQPRPSTRTVPDSYMPNTAARAMMKDGKGAIAYNIALCGGLGTEPRTITQTDALEKIGGQRKKAIKELNEMAQIFEPILGSMNAPSSVALPGNRGAAAPLASSLLTTDGNGHFEGESEFSSISALRGGEEISLSLLSKTPIRCKTGTKLSDTPKKTGRRPKVYTLPTRAALCAAYGVKDNGQYLSTVPPKYGDWRLSLVEHWIRRATASGVPVTNKPIQDQFGIGKDTANKLLRLLCKGDKPRLIKYEVYTEQIIGSVEQFQTMPCRGCDKIATLEDDPRNLGDNSWRTVERWLSEGKQVVYMWRNRNRYIHADNVKSESLEDVVSPRILGTNRNSATGRGNVLIASTAMQRRKASAVDGSGVGIAPRVVASEADETADLIAFMVNELGAEYPIPETIEIRRAG